MSDKPDPYFDKAMADFRRYNPPGGGGGGVSKKGCLVVPIALLVLLTALGALVERGVLA